MPLGRFTERNGVVCHAAGSFLFLVAPATSGSVNFRFPTEGRDVLRPIRHFMPRAKGHPVRLLWILAVIALTAAACGGDGTVDVEDGAVDDVATTDDDPETQDPEPSEPDEASDNDAADLPLEDELDDDGEHRMSAALRSSIDCNAVATSSPGATIVFPDSNDPSSLQVGTGPVTVEVVGCSDTFEANVQYDAFHEQDTQPTISGFTEGGTLGSWDEFSFEETYWTSGDWTVIVFVTDAQSGNRVEYDQVTFTVS